jgi:CRISPR-associated protein Cmr3
MKYYYYEFSPVDTLFFRGAIPLEAGLPVSDVLFPPPVSVFAGAVRTAGGPDYWNEEIKINVSAILLKKEDSWYAQAPYSWFVKDDKAGEDPADKEKTVIRARDNSEEFEKKGALASAWPLPWIDDGDAKTIGGKWVDLGLFKEGGGIKIREAGPLFDTEDRVGVALDGKTGTTVEGRLYTARHIRLRDGVSIVAAMDNPAGLGEKGILQLGGEGRRCEYQKIEGLPLNWNEHSDLYVALAPIPCTAELLDKTFCAKTFVVSGWDLKQKRHKASETWFYAGSVFTENVNGQCVALAG